MAIIANFIDFCSSTIFMPHGYCYQWIPSLVALHAISDAGIALAYLIIPLTLAYFVNKRADIPFGWIFFCFSAFILSCGATHIISIWTLWYANYWLSGMVKAFTGVISLITAALLIKLIPQALKLPSQQLLQMANHELEAEIRERKQTELELKDANAQLQIAVISIKEAQKKLEEQNRIVQEASRLKSEFLANMSHELRTPLNGIIGFSELMYREMVGPVTPEHKEYLGDILSSSQHLLQLINDILDLSKIEAGKIDFKPEAINLDSLIREVRDSLYPLMNKKNMHFTTITSNDLNNIILDPIKFKQILYNFISNAIKFTPENGSVTLALQPENATHFRLEVRDTGIGIKQEDVSKLFVKFQQLDASITKKYPGTGLGLALTRRIVEAIGGYIGVNSEFGKGSTFYAVLPYRCKTIDNPLISQ